MSSCIDPGKQTIALGSCQMKKTIQENDILETLSDLKFSNSESLVFYRQANWLPALIKRTGPFRNLQEVAVFNKHNNYNCLKARKITSTGIFISRITTKQF